MLFALKLPQTHLQTKCHTKINPYFFKTYKAKSSLMRQPRQTLQIYEFDLCHSLLCKKPAKGHAHKGVPISTVIQARENGQM